MANRRRGHNDGSIYQRKSDGKWVAAVSLPDGSRQYLYAGTRKEAQAKLRDAQRQLEAGLPPTPERLTLAAYLAEWLATVRVTAKKEKTYVGHEGYVRNHILPALGKVKLGELRPQQVQLFYNALLTDKGLSPTTVNHLAASLHKALGAAVRLGLVPLNVCDRVDVPRMAHHEIRPLSREEVKAFLDVARGDRLSALYSTAVHTGMRQGELLSVRWGDVDLASTPGVLRVRGLFERRDGAWAWTEPKTKRSRRQILLTPRVAEELRAHRERQLSERERARDAWGLEQGDFDLVFPTRVGTRILPRNLYRGFKKLLTEAGLPGDVRFHDLRHTCATLLLGARVNPKVVSELLGHASIAITLDIYSHVLPDMQRDAAAALAQLLDE